jgi:hypothetical protein
MSSRPLIATTLESLPPHRESRGYDPIRQLLVDSDGHALIDQSKGVRRARTFTERDPAEPPRPDPPKPQTVTRVVAVPADVAGVARHHLRFQNPPQTLTKVVQDPADPVRLNPTPTATSDWLDNVATGTVGF